MKGCPLQKKIRVYGRAQMAVEVILGLKFCIS